MSTTSEIQSRQEADTAHHRQSLVARAESLAARALPARR
jgi:hypothetical protein